MIFVYLRKTDPELDHCMIFVYLRKTDPERLKSKSVHNEQFAPKSKLQKEEIIS